MRSAQPSSLEETLHPRLLRPVYEAGYTHPHGWVASCARALIAAGPDDVGLTIRQRDHVHITGRNALFSFLIFLMRSTVCLSC